MTMRNDQLSILEEMKSVSGDIELLSIGVTDDWRICSCDRIADFMNSSSRYEFTYSFWEYVTVAFVIR